MSLLLDLGNTRLKAARADATGAPFVAAHAEADFEARFAAWLAAVVPRGTRAWLAAVAPDAVIARVAAPLHAHGIAAERVRPQAEALGLRLAYADPGTFGVDRWLALLGARARAAEPCVVALVGTALTVDALDAHGGHRGGLIAPSPETMRAALVAHAPRLAAAPGEVHPFARSTPDAIASGCTLAAAALIERSLAELAAHTRVAPQLLVAGGGAPPLLPWLPQHRHLPALVLEGLARWAAHAGG